MASWVKSLPAVSVSHMGTPIGVLTALLLIQLPAYAPRKVSRRGLVP